MFYSQFILAKKGPLGTIWIAAHLERKLRKNQVADTDIGVSVDSIIFPEVPIALRLSSHLMLGVVRIYSRKVNYLFHDCSEALLKIKQAFRSTAVDLPPEESTAPYHSITLPETFHLDDFELPEAAFQGDIDHHISTKEQITLQDNPERIGYSTSQFGLDERFGDGNSSHIGLDLEEELLMNKDQFTHDASIQLGSDDGILTQGQSAVPPTDMDVDDNRSKDEYAEGRSGMNRPSSFDKLNLLNSDDVGRKNDLSNWNGYNVQTPDLNEIFFHNNNIAGPSASYNQPSPFPGEEPTSPEFVDCAQAPATPGLMEETIPSRVRESPVLSPQRKTSPTSNDNSAKADNSVAPASDIPHPSTANGNHVMDAEMEEAGSAKLMQVESTNLVQGADPSRQQTGSENMQPQVATDGGILTSSHLLETSNLEVASHDGIIYGIISSSSNLEVAPRDGMVSSSHLLETSNLEVATDKSAMDAEICNSLKLHNDSLLESGETGSIKVTTMQDGASVENTSELFANGSIEPLVPENAVQFSEASVEIHGHNLRFPNVTQTTENAVQFSEASVEIQGHNLHFPNVTETTADFQSTGQVIAEDVPSIDRPDKPSTSEFPEPEKMLLAPHGIIDQENDLAQITAEKGVTESDGSNKVSSLSGRKRRLEDSLPALESGSTGKLSSRPRGRRSNDLIPRDDDLLASILGGKWTPGLRLGSTPPPPKATSSKRPRVASKMATPKRKVLMDDAMVLHADTIRQQLISTEDIRRVRKKAPCTRCEIWMIEKGSLEDEIFNESVLSCASPELSNLQYRTYKTYVHHTIRNMELQGRANTSGVEAQHSNDAGTSGSKDNSIIGHPPHTEPPNIAQTCAVHPEETFVLDAADSSVLPVPSAEQVSNELEVIAGDRGAHGPIEPLIEEANGAKVVGNDVNADLSSDAAVHTQVGTIENASCPQELPADFQKSMSCVTPLVVLDDNIPSAEAVLPNDSATGMGETKVSTSDVVLDGFDPVYMSAIDEIKDEMNDGVHDEVRVFEKEVPNSEITGVESIHKASDVPRPTENVLSIMAENKEIPNSEITGAESIHEASDFPQATEHVLSTMGENSGFQENNLGSCMDVDNVGHDFALKECSDFGSAIQGVDTDFLNYDDEVDYDDEANDDLPNPEEFHSLDNSGWSSRTRGVARYLKTLFDEESGHGRKSVAIDHLLSGKTRKEASRMFFETLVLKTKDYIHVEQLDPFDFVSIKPGIKLMKSDF